MRCFRILLLAALVALAGGHASAEPVTVRAAAHDTYGRIVFGWQTPVKYTATIADRRLTIHFDRPIEADVRQVPRALGKYVTGATPGADGQSVTFTLADDFTLSHFPQGASVVVDLALAAPKDAAKAEAPAAPAPKPQAKAEETAPKPAPQAAPAAAPAAAAPSGPAVPVRVGEHADKTRLVFDWTSEVPYRFAKAGTTATLVFGQAANVDVRSIQARPPKYVGGARAEATGDGVAVTFSVPASSEVKHFRSGAKVVVDILPPTGNDSAPPLAATQTALAAASITAPGTAPGGGVRAAPTTTPPRTAPAPTALQPQPQVAATAAPAAAPPAAQTGRAPGRPGQVPAPAAPSVTGTGEAISIRLDWEDSVAAALFRRGGSLFAVFDKPVELNVQKLKQAGGAALREVEQLPSTQGTIIRFTTVSGVNPDLKRDGLAWILEFRQQGLNTLAPIDVRVQPTSPQGPRILMQVPQPGNPVTVTDPEFGDNMLVIPIVTLGYGVAQFHRYPQLQILPSGQGVVVMPRIDTLRIRTSRQGIEISSSNGLQVSGVSAEQQGREQSSMRSFSKVLELDKWKNDSLATFTDKRLALQQAVATAKDQARETARLDLARFYVANGFGAEAVGVLEVLRSADEGIAKNAEFHVLRGVGEFLLGHYADARAALEHEAARNLDEAAFWRAASEAAEGQLLNASSELRRTGGITRQYPRTLKILGGTLVAEASAALGDVRQGTLFIEAVGRDKPSPAEQAKLNFVDGLLKEQAGDFDGAVANWEAVIKSPHRPSRAKAIVARAELLLKLNKITFRQAIEDLEKLRFAWRGDEFEFNLLRRLGALYVSDGDYRSGLTTLRQAATYFREHPQAPDVTQQMTDVFAKLYLEDAADLLPPVVAIALYEEFKELTPAGTKGDEMIRKLADRLVKIEVFDRATELLDAQIQFRLKGPDKARVGAQLALVQLMTKNGEKAIEALKKSDEPGLPADLVQQRRHLYARSQMELGRAPAALELLKDDKSADADLLRAEIFWEAKDWPNAAQSLRKVVQTYETGANAKLQPRQARHVLDLAIAFTLGGNERALDRLRRDYADAMDKTEFKDAFRLVASTSPETVNDVRAIAGKVKEAESLRTFLSSYRDKLKKQPLSAIN